MRPVQYTITPQDVEECASAVLQDAIGLKDRGRKCRATLLWHILLYAAARITSIFDACQRLTHAPSDDAVRQALVAGLPPIDELDPDGITVNVLIPGGPTDTPFLQVDDVAVDRDGNLVSLIQSNYAAFGSGITVRGMGFALQNRGALFSLDPSHPNALAPRKRPFHTIIPAFMERGNQHIGFGIMGGPNQPLAHAQFVSNVVDYGMNIQAALESPRFTVSSRRGCNILIESRAKPDTLQQLSGMGHQLEVRKEYSPAMGRGQAVLHDSQSHVNYGASDARSDGSAEPEPPPLK